MATVITTGFNSFVFPFSEMKKLLNKDTKIKGDIEVNCTSPDQPADNRISVEVFSSSVRADAFIQYTGEKVELMLPVEEEPTLKKYTLTSRDYYPISMGHYNYNYSYADSLYGSNMMATYDGISFMMLSVNAPNKLTWNFFDLHEYTDKELITAICDAVAIVQAVHLLKCKLALSPDFKSFAATFDYTFEKDTVVPTHAGDLHLRVLPVSAEDCLHLKVELRGMSAFAFVSRQGDREVIVNVETASGEKLKRKIVREITSSSDSFYSSTLHNFLIREEYNPVFTEVLASNKLTDIRCLKWQMYKDYGICIIDWKCAKEENSLQEFLEMLITAFGLQAAYYCLQDTIDGHRVLNRYNL